MIQKAVGKNVHQCNGPLAEDLISAPASQVVVDRIFPLCGNEISSYVSDSTEINRFLLYFFKNALKKLF